MTESTTTSNDSSTADSPSAADPAHEAGSEFSISKIGMWLFITTEIMLFVAVVAAYLVFRLSTLQDGWPGSSLMHVSLFTGLVNTIILVMSGVTAWAMYRACHEDRFRTAKLWLVVTILLAVTFVGIKSTEYVKKYNVGLMPVANERQFHNRANVAYVSHVNDRLKQSIATLERRATDLDRENLELPEDQARQLDFLYELKQNMSEATARTVGRSSSLYRAQLAMNLMAWQIYPHPDTSHNLHDFLEPELKGLRVRHFDLRERMGLVFERQILVQQQVTELSKQLEEFRLVNTDSNALQERERWLQVKQNQLQELGIEENRLESIVAPISGRIDNLIDSFGSEGEFLGLNERYDLRLPVVVPNGQSWMNVYLLLTGVHLLHLLAGLAVLLWWLPRRLVGKRAPALFLTCMYWQFVDAVWLAIFWLIYF